MSSEGVEPTPDDSNTGPSIPCNSSPSSSTYGLRARKVAPPAQEIRAPSSTPTYELRSMGLGNRAGASTVPSSGGSPSTAEQRIARRPFSAKPSKQSLDLKRSASSSRAKAAFFPAAHRRQEASGSTPSSSRVKRALAPSPPNSPPRGRHPHSSSPPTSSSSPTLKGPSAGDCSLLQPREEVTPLTEDSVTDWMSLLNNYKSSEGGNIQDVGRPQRIVSAPFSVESFMQMQQASVDPATDIPPIMDDNEFFETVLYSNKRSEVESARSQLDMSVDAIGSSRSGDDFDDGFGDVGGATPQRIVREFSFLDEGVEDRTESYCNAPLSPRHRSALHRV